VPSGQRGQRLYGANGGAARGERGLRAASVRVRPGEGAALREGAGARADAEVAGRGARRRGAACSRLKNVSQYSCLSAKISKKLN
jgi:hypothetical protein